MTAPSVWPEGAREAVARAICVALGDDPDREGCRLTAYDAPADAALAALAPWVAQIEAAARTAERTRILQEIADKAPELGAAMRAISAHTLPVVPAADVPGDEVRFVDPASGKAVGRIINAQGRTP